MERVENNAYFHMTGQTQSFRTIVSYFVPIIFNIIVTYVRISDKILSPFYPQNSKINGTTASTVTRQHFYIIYCKKKRKS